MNHFILAAIAALLLLCTNIAKAGTDAAMLTASAKDTIVMKLKKGEKLMIITKKDQMGISSLTEYDLNRMIQQVDSVMRSANAVIYNKDGQGRFSMRDTTIMVTTTPMKNEQSKLLGIKFSRDSARNIVLDFRTDTGKDTSVTVKKKKDYFENTGVYLNLGLNNWIDRGTGKFPDAQGLPHGLRPLGSRYVSLGTVRYFPLTKKSPVSFSLGLEVAWYNFMLSNNSFKPVNGASGILFDSIGRQPQYAGKELNVTKSKLVESVIKVPAGFRFKLNKFSSVELGGYAGYRLGSHTKLKYEIDGQTRKDKDRDNFYLNNFQYGLRAQVRIYGIGVFGEYGLQPVFGKGPDLRTLAFGINLL